MRTRKNNATNSIFPSRASTPATGQLLARKADGEDSGTLTVNDLKFTLSITDPYLVSDPIQIERLLH